MVTQEMPFKLTYSYEAMISVEIGQSSNRQEAHNEIMNGEWQREELDLLLEVREQAHLQNEKHKALIAWTTNKKMKARSFPEWTVVFHRVDNPHRRSKEGKLAPNWEGPFRVKQNLSNRAYKLEMIDGKPILRTWNRTHLRAYYVQV